VWKTLHELDWNLLMLAPGLPTQLDFENSLSREAIELSSKWIAVANGNKKVSVVSFDRKSEEMKVFFVLKKYVKYFLFIYYF
jgi:hypothetical protein